VGVVEMAALCARITAGAASKRGIDAITTKRCEGRRVSISLTLGQIDGQEGLRWKLFL
jgi:hypothetical protein